MIISDEHRFAFVHIPKCAGTSVRKALRPIDETIGRFDCIAEHPQMGMVNFGHLTLVDLAAYFPDQYAKVKAYRSVAIVRDPVDRFFSALFQRLREFKGYSQSEITPQVIDAEAATLTRYLQSATGRLDLEYVHFNRQSDYVFNNNMRIVERVFALDRLGDAATYIEGVTGVRLAADVPENRTVALRAGALMPVVRALRAPYRTLVPPSLRHRFHAGMTRIGLYGSVEKQRLLKPDSDLERFLKMHYQRDFELYAAARQG
jgi:hypothetical protein